MAVADRDPELSHYILAPVIWRKLLPERVIADRMQLS